MTDEALSYYFRPAKKGDGIAVFDVTKRSISRLGTQHYTQDQIDNWMGARTPGYYEAEIAKGSIVVAESDGQIVGFVDAVSGEVTRLFILSQHTGHGLGRDLLHHGIALARSGLDVLHQSVKVEATLNAEGFYARHGFQRTGLGHFSHGVGGDPIEIVYMELRSPS